MNIATVNDSAVGVYYAIVGAITLIVLSLFLSEYNHFLWGWQMCSIFIVTVRTDESCCSCYWAGFFKCAVFIIIKDPVQEIREWDADSERRRYLNDDNNNTTFFAYVSDMSDGAYLVRECHHGGPNVPFTLTIRFQQRLFHIQIRLRPDSHFALGTLKHNEMHFPSVAEMIDCYKKSPLQLHSNGKFFGETKLTHPPIVYSFSSSTEKKY